MKLVKAAVLALLFTSTTLAEDTLKVTSAEGGSQVAKKANEGDKADNGKT